MEKSFIALIEQSIKKNWDLDALTDYKGVTLQYKDVARKIEKIHIILEESGVKPGDKIAVCGRNMSHWGVTFLSVVTYGAIIVPILHISVFAGVGERTREGNDLYHEMSETGVITVNRIGGYIFGFQNS